MFYLNKEEERYYNKPPFLTISGIVLLTIILISYLSYKNFERSFEAQTVNIATKANKELENSMLYTENIANFIANQIVDKERLTKEEIAKILRNTKPRLDQKQDIFSQIFFDFIDKQDNIIVTESDGILANPYRITKEKRSWIESAKINTWKLIPAKKDKGIITQEIIIPCGFGISRKNGEFVGIITGGINVDKLQEKLKALTTSSYNITILDYENHIISTSDSYVTKQENKIKKEIEASNYNSGFINIEGNKFYYQKTEGYEFKILVGIEEQNYNKKLLQYSLPEIIDNLYLTAFLVILIYLIVRILFL